jgi:hypothetical protein
MNIGVLCVLALVIVLVFVIAFTRTSYKRAAEDNAGSEGRTSQLFEAG